MTEKRLSLSDEFLADVVNTFDDDTVSAIILHGSYARGDALPPYSDVDLVRITKETPNHKQEKRFLWHNGYLLNLSSRPLSIYERWLSMPEEAIFRIQSIREAHILLDKDETFQAFQEKALTWQWEPLQSAANGYSSQLLLEQTEIILKILRVLQEPNLITLIELTLLDILDAVTKAVAVQRGVVVRSGHSYLHQVMATAGSAWTQLYLRSVGETQEPNGSVSLVKRGRASLSLYHETVQLLRCSLHPEHAETIEPILSMITDALKDTVA